MLRHGPPPTRPISTSGTQDDAKNPLGIQLLPPTLQNKLFSLDSHPSVPSAKIQLAKDYLRAVDLLDKNLAPMPSVSFLASLLPPLAGYANAKGISIEEHFDILGREQQEPYYSLAQKLSKTSLPPLPQVWTLNAGWTRYDAKDGSVTQVPFPDADALVFDSEVLYKINPYPVMAMAASADAWFAWISPALLSRPPLSQHDNNIYTASSKQASSSSSIHPSLLSMGSSDSPKLIIGHHIAFDRARIQEEYRIQGTQYAYLDTMSLHSTIGGLSSQQRGTWLKHKKTLAADALASASRQNNPSGSVAIEPEETHGGPKDWRDVGSVNNLKDVYKLYTGKDLCKDARNEFDTTNIQDIQDPELLQKLLTYCATDVLAAHELFCRMLPKFLDKCPHPVSFAGMLHMGKSYLPVTEDWNHFIKLAEEKCTDYQKSIEERLLELAVKALQDPDASKKDPWLKHLDWTVTPPKRGKPSPFSPTQDMSQVTQKKELGLAPKWFKDLWDAKLKKIRITTTKRVSPYLLKLQWKSHPLHYTACFGWTFKIPVAQTAAVREENRLAFSIASDDKEYDAYASLDQENAYYRLPHPDGEGKNCGNPLAKSFLAAFEDGTLTSAYSDAKAILALNAQCSYWVSARQRIADQFVVWNSDDKIIGNVHGPKGQNVGVILPQSVAMGTVTRRAVESTWMTAANAKSNRIGSELKSLIQAPDGYKFVGADVDSQELWIASLLGDAQFGIHGATPIGFMTLQGTKSLKTDLHSVTGNIIGVSRDSAKVFNYSRIYGAGAKHAVQLLLKDNPGISRKEAELKVTQLYQKTKGRRFGYTYRNKSSSLPLLWYGGSESFMFNAMENIARSEDPRTPVLNCGIPDSLLPKYVDNNYMTSRVNWVVQSSGVDYLHLLLVSMNYLVRRMKIEARFLISIHDEVRFLVKEEHRNHAVLALQISNLWVRSMFAQRVGIYNLPQNIAFFSSVEVDHCLRKEVDKECLTPSNLIPIKAGTAVDIFQALEYFKSSTSESLFGTELKTIEDISWTGPMTQTSRCSAQAASELWIRMQMAQSEKQIRELYRFVQ